MEVMLKNKNGTEIEGGLTREEWEQVVHQASGVIPYRIVVIDTKRAYILFFHETNIFRVSEILNAITEYKGNPVQCSTLMQDRVHLENRLEKERLGMRDSQISLEALAEERSRYQRELETFRNDVNVRLLALQQERQGNKAPAATGRGVMIGN